MEVTEVMRKETFDQLVHKLAEIMLDNISQQIDPSDKSAMASRRGFHNAMLICWGQLRGSVSTEQADYMDTLVN